MHTIVVTLDCLPIGICLESRPTEPAALLQVVEAAAGVDDGSASAISQLFSTAKTAGINVVRFFPFGIEPSFTLEPSPGR